VLYALLLSLKCRLQLCDVTLRGNLASMPLLPYRLTHTVQLTIVISMSCLPGRVAMPTQVRQGIGVSLGNSGMYAAFILAKSLL
jgi:hypothetical protein